MDSCRSIVALDGDGVLLDYNTAYALAWQRAFGVRPRELVRDAYWPMDRYEVERLDGERLARFRGEFDQVFWSTIPAMPGALKACEELADAGYELVCVTALDQKFVEARRANLKDLGFPIRVVIATEHAHEQRSPKAAALEAIRPVAFVDDYLPYMRGLPEYIHKALVVRDPFGSPNQGDGLGAVDSTHLDLKSFAHWWLHQRVSTE